MNEFCANPFVDEFLLLDSQVRFSYELGESIAEVERTHDEGYKYRSLMPTDYRQVIHKLARTRLSTPAFNYLDETFGFKPDELTLNALSALTYCYHVIKDERDTFKDLDLGVFFFDGLTETGAYRSHYSKDLDIGFVMHPFRDADFFKGYFIHKGFDFSKAYLLLQSNKDV